MWAEFNELAYPIIEVKLNKTIENDEDFNDFLKGWVKYYERKKNFIFIFDTTDVGFVNIKYALKMASFIKELKKQDIQYLKHSIIVSNNWWIKLLLKIIFAIQSPVCAVEHCSNFDKVDVEQLINTFNGRLIPELQ